MTDKAWEPNVFEGLLYVLRKENFEKRLPTLLLEPSNLLHYMCNVYQIVLIRMWSVSQELILKLRRKVNITMILSTLISLLNGKAETSQISTS